MDTKLILKFAILGVGGYLLYKYLENSGIWGQFFGFSTDQQLAAYCQANPNGTATYNGQNAPCTQWMQALAAGRATAPATTQPSAPATLTADEQALATKLQNFVLSGGWGTPPFNVWQWNFVFKQMSPGASDAQLPNPAELIDAGTYVHLRNQGGFGLSGIVPVVVNRPYRWMN